MSISLLELRTQARQVADMEDNEFISDTELNNYINFAIAELHDILVSSYGEDYFLNEISGQTVSNTNAYDLPSDFYKLKGVDVKLNGSDYASLNQFNFNERNKYEDFGSWTLLGISNIRYRVMGNKIRFTPTPDANVDYRLWYIPKATKLVADEDTLDDINQYSDMIILSAAIKMLMKEESDTTALSNEKMRIISRIEEDSKNRNAGDAESISDVYAENNSYIWYTSKG